MSLSSKLSFVKTLIVSLTFLLSVFTVAAQDSKSAPSIKFKEVELDFGTIEQGDKAHLEYIFHNIGIDPLVIIQAKGSCGCTVPEYPTEPLKKGEKGSIKVTFDSAGKMGKQEKTVTLITNTPDSPIILKIKGTIVPAPAKNVPEDRPMEHPKN